jgi:hypothetical protein
MKLKYTWAEFWKLQRSLKVNGRAIRYEDHFAYGNEGVTMLTEFAAILD